MRASEFDYGEVLTHKNTGFEVKVSERNGEKVFISEDGDVFDDVDMKYYE